MPEKNQTCYIIHSSEETSQLNFLVIQKKAVHQTREANINSLKEQHCACIQQELTYKHKGLIRIKVHSTAHNSSLQAISLCNRRIRRLPQQSRGFLQPWMSFPHEIS